jgi:hypothetical protein
VDKGRSKQRGGETGETMRTVRLTLQLAQPGGNTVSTKGIQIKERELETYQDS